MLTGRDFVFESSSFLLLEDGGGDKIELKLRPKRKYVLPPLRDLSVSFSASTADHVVALMQALWTQSRRAFALHVRKPEE